MSEKQNPYLKCPSGGPMIQHSLVLMLELVRQGVFTYNQVVEKMCHAPAKLFKIIKRGYIEPGYYADIVLVDPKSTHKVTTQNILYKCGWSPLLGDTFSHQVVNTIINGNVVFDQGLFQKHPVSPLEYNL
jgi:dihydroorotase